MNAVESSLRDGFECTRLSSSTDALAQFSKNPDQFDLIISDQTMPELTGLEMITKMRNLREDIPAIITTGYSGTLNHTIANENNITLLRKPVEKIQLLTAINDVLSER